MFNKKVILITGGTGSFGKTFVKFLLKNFKPKKLIIFSRDEMKQFEMSNMFNANKFKCLRYFIGDVRDQERLKIATKDVDFIIHAAALKQVPAAEYNPIECIKTNILGTQNVVMAALENKVKKVLALSTDKAVNPINLYGATKLASDKLIISANNFVGSKSKFSLVRYGNVIGSRASVIPFFINLIKNSSTFLPITEKDMTRFWITINQGIELVNHAFNDMKGGEIYVPKIPSIKITDLAKAMGPKLKQKIIGIRPGEKIHESLTSKDESSNVLMFKNYYVITPNYLLANLKKYKKNFKGEIGKKVEQNFEYNSGTNKHFLTINEIKDLNNFNLKNDTL